MKKIFPANTVQKLPVLLLAAALLAGCGTAVTDDAAGGEASSSDAITHTIPEDAEIASETINVIVEDDSTPPQEGMVRSRLTNEWVDAKVAEQRPIAVIIPNETAALPHYNLSEASILYEANVEGRMTRMMAIYEDWDELHRIGNVRSARTYYFYWAFEWDAFLVHYGGPFYIDSLVEQSTTEHIDGMSSPDEDAFFRSTDRSEPHNAYLDGSELSDIIERKGYSSTYRGIADDTHFQFASKAEPNALTEYGDNAYNATYIDLSGCYPLTRCFFEYNDEDGLYYRSQHLSGGEDEPHIDGYTGEQLRFKNILVQYTHQDELDTNGYLELTCVDNTRDGWFFTNGRGIHVTWTKESDYGATRYYDDNGNEITLNTGKTMICVVDESDSLTFR